MNLFAVPFRRISGAHLQSIQDLQRRIAGFETISFKHEALAGDDTLSLAGFSDVSDLEDCANALDVFVGVGEIDLSAGQRLQEELNRWVSEVPIAPPMPSVVEELRSLVSIELIGFDLGFSAVAAGLQPVYDSLVTFGPFNVNDATLDEFARGQLKVEMHGTLPGSEKQHLLGQGVLPMAGLLQYGTQDRANSDHVSRLTVASQHHIQLMESLFVLQYPYCVLLCAGIEP